MSNLLLGTNCFKIFLQLRFGLTVPVKIEDSSYIVFRVYLFSMCVKLFVPKIKFVFENTFYCLFTPTP